MSRLFSEHRGRSRGRVQGVRTPSPLPRDDLWFSNTTGILRKKELCGFGVEVERETSAPPPKKSPGSAPGTIETAINNGVRIAAWFCLDPEKWLS